MADGRDKSDVNTDFFCLCDTTRSVAVRFSRHAQYAPAGF